MANLKTRVGLFFDQIVGSSAKFVVRPVSDAAVSGSEYLQNAVSKIGLPARDGPFTLEEISRNIPKKIDVGELFAKKDGSGYWEVSDTSVLDTYTAKVSIDGGTYDENSSFTWEQGGQSGGAGASYTWDTPSEPPESMEGYEKHVVGGHVYFMPPKDSLDTDFPIVADRDIDGGNSAAFLNWAHAYAGEELPESHVWLAYDTTYWFSSEPWVWESSSPGTIDYWHSPSHGYVLERVNYFGGYYIHAEVYTSPSKPYIYYPSRLPIPPWGDPQLIHPIPTDGGVLPNLLSSWLPKAGKNREVPFIYEALTSQGEPLTANGLPLEGRKY